MTQVSGWWRGPGTSRMDVAQCSGGGLDRRVLGVDVANSGDLPSEDYGNTQRPSASTGPRIELVHLFTLVVP